MKKTEPSARVETVNRKQHFLDARDFDALIAPEHPARAVWAFVEGLDLSKFYERIRSREGGLGRSATDPKVLLALWLFGISEGEGSARELVRLTESHDAYRWLRGGVGLNHHTVSDFRTGHPEAVNELLTQMLASLLDAKLLTLQRVAQDGTKIRANAGAASFKRKETLHKLMKVAKRQLREVDAAARDSTTSQRQQAALERAAEDRAARVAQALAKLPLVRTQKAEKKRDTKGKKKSEPRASTTDPDARIMKDGGGGYRPSFNVQLATEEKSGLIIDALVTTSPADNHQLLPMLDAIEERLGERPEQLLADAGYIHFDSVEALADRDVELFMSLDSNVVIDADGKRIDPLESRPTDSPAVAALRRRMKSDSGKRIYAKRGQVAEFPNAVIKERMGLRQFLVRGMGKVQTVMLLTVLAYNMQRLFSLGWA